MSEGISGYVIITYGPGEKRRAEALRWFFGRLGLDVELRELEGVEGVYVKYDGVAWGDPDEAIRYIVDRLGRLAKTR